MSADDSGQRLLDAIRGYAPKIAARGLEIETARRLPRDLVEDLRALGLFRMMVPESHGGLDVDFSYNLKICSALSAADGSTGWTATFGGGSCMFLSLLPRATFDEIYAGGPDVIVAGALPPNGTAEIVDGGYRVSGRWGFVSGAHHADYINTNCVVTKNGVPVPGPAPGVPLLRAFMLPAANYEIIDTWHAAGMKGSGSPDVTLRDVFAPESRAFNLTGGKPCVEGPYFFGQFTLHAFHFAAMAAGIAQGALDDLTAIALSGKGRALARQRMADSELFHDTLGRAEADLKAALALFESESMWCWREAHNGPLRRAVTVRVLQSVVWIIDASVRVVDACHTAAGGGSIYESAPLQRRLRDIHVLTQHALLRKQAYADSGAARLGHAPTIPFGRE